MLVSDPPPANSTTDMHAHHVGYGDQMANLFFGLIDNRRSFSTRQNQVIWDEPLHIAVTFQPFLLVSILDSDNCVNFG